MPFSVRSAERDAVAAILGSEDFDDEQQMATEIVKTVWTELCKREVFAVFPAAGVAGYGPFASEKDAERAWTRGIGAAYGGQRGRLLRVRPWDETEALADLPCVCGHRKDQHGDKGRCAVYGTGMAGPRAKTKPNLPSCGCSGYERNVA